MDYPQPQLWFAGFPSEGEATIQRTAGVVPNQITARFLLRDEVPQYGDITLVYGDQTRTLSNCKVSRAVITGGGGGGRWQECTIEDRRWTWRYHRIYGRYNVYEKGVKVEGVQSVKELAELCFDAMQESPIPDISMLPDDVYPPVEWGGMLAAKALEDLLDTFGFILCPQSDDSFRICKFGIGESYPTDERVMDGTLVFEPPVIPEILRIESGPIRFQVDIPLKPVGEEYDTKQVKDIDDLSYKPTTGWGKCDAEKFMEVPAGTAEAPLPYRELAQRCIWKWFKPDLSSFDHPIEIPRPETIPDGIEASSYFTLEPDELWRILPFDQKQLKLYRSYNATRLDFDDELTDAQVIGYFYDDRISYRNYANNPPDSVNQDTFVEGLELDGTLPAFIWKGGFSIDEARGLVMTNQPCYLLDRGVDGINAPGKLHPKICLRTSFPLRDPDTREVLRMLYEVRYPDGVPGLVNTIRVEELVYEVGNTVKTDKDKFEEEASFYARKEEQTYLLGRSVSVPMKGWCFDIEVDGAIRSVRMSKSPSGGTTQVDWQNDNPTKGPTYKDKREAARVARVVEKQEIKAKEMETSTGRKTGIRVQ